MARRGSFTATGALLVTVALAAAGCGVGRAERDTLQDSAVEVVAALGAEGQALAALGLDPEELDADPGTAAPVEPTPSAADKRKERVEEWRKRRAARVLLRKNTLHGDVVVQTKDGGTKTVSVQRGEVTALTDDKITVKSTDGFTRTWTFTDDLRVIERRKSIAATDIKVGTRLGVAGTVSGEQAQARLIVVPFEQK
ncbi:MULTISPECIES: hypothetical protein [unclassified Micromonospora]|uniref:hypothetical protein n=1 Tax=unclassified Micromonospora TaxID=2617518 RepID=UPI0022B64BA1|nr:MULTISPECIES: hypothetical protein [unclassified Micromonospora]MCZ7421871.1 hypothetical protein [Verrucosispora sp. WMMA2121]WBB93471.1 hypothetical protein O7597_11080 [Verrucosispora sp. WMMC514]